MKLIFHSQFKFSKGILGLWRGSAPTVIRAMTVNLGMLASYDYCKDLSIYVFGGTAKDPSTMAVASFLSGVFASVISLPSDNIKTKLMKRIILSHISIPTHLKLTKTVQG